MEVNHSYSLILIKYKKKKGQIVMLKIKSYKKASIILEIDSAIRDGYKEYFDSMYDQSHLKLNDAMAPTIFNIVPPSSEQLDILDQFPPNSRVRARMVVAVALKSVENLFCITDNNKEIPAPPITRETLEGSSLVSSAWFKEVNLPTEVLKELAAHIMRVSEPNPI